MIYLNYYLLAINLISFVFFFFDKQKAKKNKWRIAEKTLWFIALLGGSFGSLFGMYLFKHKTKHLSFKLLLPLILFIQIYLYSYFYLLS